MAAKKVTPKEVEVTVSLGGKIQVVKFQYDSNFYLTEKVTYAVEGMTDEEVEEFRSEKLREFRKHLEPFQQEEIDKLQALRDEIEEHGEGSTETDS